MTILQEIVGILVGGITGIAEGIGGGLSTLVTSVFLDTEGGLSTFGIVVVAFGGVALAIGLSKFIVKWIASLGARK